MKALGCRRAGPSFRVMGSLRAMKAGPRASRLQEGNPLISLAVPLFCSISILIANSAAEHVAITSAKCWPSFAGAFVLY